MAAVVVVGAAVVTVVVGPAVVTVVVGVGVVTVVVGAAVVRVVVGEVVSVVLVDVEAVVVLVVDDVDGEEVVDVSPPARATAPASRALSVSPPRTATPPTPMRATQTRASAYSTRAAPRSDWNLFISVLCPSLAVIERFRPFTPSC